jgi:hypothetical protein
MNLSASLGSILSDVVAAVATAGVLAILAWFAGPLKWIVLNRRLKQLILNGRRFLFVFNPVTTQSKIVTFLPNGEIGEGRNQNEHTWRIRRGSLEILSSDSKVYSRFSHDKPSGHLKHTNDPDSDSIHGQYFQPLLIKKNAEQAVAADRAKPRAG